MWLTVGVYFTNDDYILHADSRVVELIDRNIGCIDVVSPVHEGNSDYDRKCKRSSGRP